MEEKRIFQPLSIWSKRHNRHEQCVCFCVLIRKNFGKFHLFVSKAELKWVEEAWDEEPERNSTESLLIWCDIPLYYSSNVSIEFKDEWVERKCSSVPLSFLRPRPYCIRANSLIPIFWFASDAIDCEMRMLTHNSFRTHAQWESMSQRVNVCLNEKKIRNVNSYGGHHCMELLHFVTTSRQHNGIKRCVGEVQFDLKRNSIRSTKVCHKIIFYFMLRC